MDKRKSPESGRAHVTLIVDSSALDAALKKAERVFAKWGRELDARDAQINRKLKAWGKEIAALERSAKKASRERK